MNWMFSRIYYRVCISWTALLNHRNPSACFRFGLRTVAPNADNNRKPRIRQRKLHHRSSHHRHTIKHRPVPKRSKVHQHRTPPPPSQPTKPVAALPPIQQLVSSTATQPPSGVRYQWHQQVTWIVWTTCRGRLLILWPMDKVPPVTVDKVTVQRLPTVVTWTISHRCSGQPASCLRTKVGQPEPELWRVIRATVPDRTHRCQALSACPALPHQQSATTTKTIAWALGLKTTNTARSERS